MFRFLNRVHRRLTRAQRIILEETFIEKPFPSRDLYLYLAIQTDLAFYEVVEWFLVSDALHRCPPKVRVFPKSG